MSQHTPNIIIIAAMSKDRVIGRDSGMPWDIQEEYQQYLNFIKGQTVIMGRRTFEIFGKDLTSRRQVVVSRSTDFKSDTTIGCSTFEDAIRMAKSWPQNIFIAGGGSLYKVALPIATSMFISYIKGEYTGDTYFPNFDKDQWLVHRKINHLRFTFVHYQRKRLM